MLSFSLGLAVRTFWSDLEKCPKSASGKIFGGQVNTLGDRVRDRPQKRSTKIVPKRAQTSQNHHTVIMFYMWPDLASGSQTAPDALLEGTFPP